METIIKLNDVNGNEIGTLTPSVIKNNVRFTQELNGGQGQLTIELNAINLNLDQAVSCDVYIRNQDTKKEFLVYTGILDQVNSSFSEVNETQLKFLGLGSIISYFLYYDFGTSTLEFKKELNQEPSVVLTRMIDVCNTLKVGINSITGNFQEGEIITGDTSGATATLQKIIGNDYYLLFENGRFEDNEGMIGGTSGATGTLNLVENNIFYGMLKKGNIVPYSSNINFEVDYTNGLNLFNILKDFATGYEFFINREGIVNFAPQQVNSEFQMAFGKNNISVYDNADFDIINNIYIKIENGTVINRKDTESINKYGARTVFYDRVDILDQSTAENIADDILVRRKTPLSEIRIVVFRNFSGHFRFLKWNELTEAWNTYSIPWNELGEATLILETEPGAIFDIRNIDNINKYSKLKIVRTEFTGEFITIYCNNFKNYTKLITNGVGQ